ncbi:long-chain fatty acid--CoA ligase [Leptolyngbya sp. 'hensonii']|uniref:AMP-dependent synthetase/ligase n=1 Tax=Leptolyngbya sp. 'hensonii' TaxID=1922337 RepID=UPI0009500208|nr:long-chain fatty acid--CoA ligase [Leptolyngbya sp. 'hensonii']OLP15477.1 long-chain fatty acid--CoA ligase [Leptolyngbya sp. 'hensonii']
MTTLMIFPAPPDSGSLVLGRTLPSLLDDACDRYPHERALNQWQMRRWSSLSNVAFRREVEELALGLRSLGLERGDRVALVMHSDLPFCTADMACLLAGLVDVPIDLTQTIENILFILQHTEARALVVSNRMLLKQVMPYLWDAPDLRFVLLMETDGVPQRPDSAEVEGAGEVPLFLQVLELERVQAWGRELWSAEEVQLLRDEIEAQDVATILYIAGETQRPKGVMLSHENITSNILTAFSSFPGLQAGDREVALLFLPLTHIFARAFLYGHLAYGHSIYFSNPQQVIRHLKLVHPTILIAVPRLLEKLYERMLDQENRFGSFDRTVFRWAMKLAHRYEVGKPLSALYGWQLKLADRLVFARWRSIFGDRLKALIVGGAALSAELTNVFAAAGIPVLQGYGLTETSAVLCYNRGRYNRAGTVGVPIPGVDLALATDGEILVKAPFVMQGYYRDPAATAQVMDGEGWLHTGDLGEITPDRLLRLTGVKKSLFKLTTGKYVSSLPLEQTLTRSPLVAHALAVGANRKFCGLLIVPHWAALQVEVQSLNLDLKQEFWLHHPSILALYQALVDAANCHLPDWSTVKRFRLLDGEWTVENGLLQPDGSVDRGRVLQQFAREIAALYLNDPQPERPGEPEPVSLPNSPLFTCPTYARSLTHI